MIGEMGRELESYCFSGWIDVVLDGLFHTYSMNDPMYLGVFKHCAYQTKIPTQDS